MMSMGNGNPCTTGSITTGYTESANQNAGGSICDEIAFKASSDAATETATITNNSMQRILGIGVHFNP